MKTVTRIALDELMGGMYVVRFDKPGIFFNYYGTAIPASEIDNIKSMLRNSGVRHLHVRAFPKQEVPKTLESPSAITPEDYAQIVQSHLQAKLDKERSIDYANIRDIVEAQQIHTRAKAITKSLLTEVRLGKAVKTDSAKTVINDLLGSCFKNPDAFVNMTRLKDFDDYTFTHSVNVSVLSMSIGKRLGMSPNDLETLGLGALLHDIGKMYIPENILNKPGKLNDEELQIMRLHPRYSYDILAEDKTIPEAVLNACRQHHEKSDGSGYPEGLKEKQISKYAKIIAISDVYDAITSERVYHKGMIAHDALKLLFSWSGKHFNEVLVKFFISLIGIYPVGSAVLLDSGEIAVVFEPNKRNPTHPKVILVTDANKQSCPMTLCDLANYNLTTLIPYKSILSTLNGREIDIEPNLIIERFVKSKTSSIANEAEQY